MKNRQYRTEWMEYQLMRRMNEMGLPDGELRNCFSAGFWFGVDMAVRSDVDML